MCQSARCTLNPHTWCKSCIIKESNEFFTLEDTLLQEIMDSPAEIYDIPELQQTEKFDVESYINGEIDY